MRLDRRHFLAGAAGLAVSACDKIAGTPTGRATFKTSQDLTYGVQRALERGKLAQEYPASAISGFFKPNGSIDPKSPVYRKLAAERFKGFAMKVGGMVDHPRAFTLAELRALPARTQITRHDCVEGWSCIGQWTGAPLAEVLKLVAPHPNARYVVFRCFDRYDTDYTTDAPSQDEDASQGPLFYGSIGMADALHPQTILAYDFNGGPLPVAHGAPLRVRVERQLGYKMTKYIKEIELVESFAHIGDGNGGYWEDQGYQWNGSI